MRKLFLIIAIVFSGLLIQAQTQVYELETGNLYISSKMYHGEAVLWFNEGGAFTNYYYLGVDNQHNLKLKRDTGKSARDGILVFKLNEQGYAEITLIGQPGRKQSLKAKVSVQVNGNDLTLTYLD